MVSELTVKRLSFAVDSPGKAKRSLCCVQLVRLRRGWKNRERRKREQGRRPLSHTHTHTLIRVHFRRRAVLRTRRKEKEREKKTSGTFTRNFLRQRNRGMRGGNLKK